MQDQVNRFAFVIHPLSVADIRRHPLLGRTAGLLPDRWVEGLVARLPPLHLSRITGVRSAATGQRVEGELFSIGATPGVMLRLPPRHTYDQLLAVARQAARDGARILGLGAFTHIVGDAGVTVARESPIPVTTGNSLTVAALLEAAKMAARSMGREDLARGRAMVIGATGAIGAVCSRLLAQAIRDVVLVSIEPERLQRLAAIIAEETPGTRVEVATDSDELVGDCDLVVTATSAHGDRVLDLALCKPGAVVCDVARPCDITEEDAAVRPDVLVIESGEVLLPGEADLGYDIGLPPGVAYACLAETVLLALDGRFECFTLGRELETARVKEIYHLAARHGLRVAGLRSFGRWVREEELAVKRVLAERLRRDRGLLAATRQRAGELVGAVAAARL